MKGTNLFESIGGGGIKSSGAYLGWDAYDISKYETQVDSWICMSEAQMKDWDGNTKLNVKSMQMTL